MDQSQLKYAIRVDERATFIRFYLWLWKARKYEITFCKLFWGYVFAAPALMVRGFYALVIIPIVFLATLVGKGIAGALFFVLDSLPEKRSGLREVPLERWKREEEQMAAEAERRIAKEREGPSQMQRTLSGIEHYGTIASMKARPLAEGVGTAKKHVVYAGQRTATKVSDAVSIPVVGRGLLVLAGLLGVASVVVLGVVAAPYGVAAAKGVGSGVGAGVGATGEAATEVFHSKYSLWTVLGIVGLSLFVLVVWALAIVGIFSFLVRYALEPTGRGVAKGAVAGVEVIEGGLSGFFRAMKIGYHGVKTNTCPRIEIEPRPDYARTRNIERELDL